MTILFFLLLFFLPPIDTDLGWHLRGGQHFLQTGKILNQNHFTYYLANHHFINPTFFYEIITALIYRLAGFWGLAFLTAAVLTFSFFLLTKINQKLTKISFLGTIIVLIFSWQILSLGLRSQIFSFVFLVLLFWLISKIEKHPKLVFALPPLFFLWANFHGGFFLGFVILSNIILAKILAGRLFLSFRLLIVLIISFFASLLNPYGLKIYQWVFLHLKTPLNTLIAEWVSPSFTLQIIIFATTVLLLSCLSVLTVEKKFFWGFNLVFFAFLSLSARRNLPLFALTAFLAALDIFKKELHALEEKKFSRFFYGSVITIGLPAIVIFHLPRSLNMINNWQSYCLGGLTHYPCAAVEFVKKNPLDGVNVYNVYEWGGFLEWQLPSYKYFVDGRMPAWETPEGKSPYTVYLEIIQAQPGYQKILDRYHTDWLFIGAGTFLDLKLQEDPNTPWQEVYRDDIAVIYQRKEKF